MAKRGRKTSGDMEVVENIPVRPEPPSDLKPVEADIWRQVMAGLAADWFGSETLDDLRSYCVHKCTVRELSEQMDQDWDTLSVTDKQKLLKAREIESRVAITYATKLRITKQSTVRAEKSKKPGAGTAPWKNLNS